MTQILFYILIFLIGFIVGRTTEDSKLTLRDLMFVIVCSFLAGITGALLANIIII